MNNNIVYEAGCNYYVNQGNHPEEPIGTATSMHDCSTCHRISYCLIKKETSTWEYNQEIAEQMDEDWERTIKYEKEFIKKKK